MALVSSRIHKDGLQIIEVYQNEEDAPGDTFDERGPYTPPVLFLTFEEAGVLAADLLTAIKNLGTSDTN